MRTYLFGYRGGRLTLDQMNQQQGWAKLDPEFRRRLVAAFDAARDAGTDLGIGEGWRSSDVQRRGFLDRHLEVTAEKPHCCKYDGKCYQLKKGRAHMAPPGRSYHEGTTPDGKALAADLVGDLKWFARNCARFGLNEASRVNSEPWHSQCAELPRARAYWRPAMHPLHEFPLQPQPAVPFPGQLKIGSIGPNVRLVQKRVGATADGIYGPRTKARVVNFQRGHGLLPDGIVDIDDWQAMFGAAA